MMKNLLFSLLAVVLFSCTTVQGQESEIDMVEGSAFTLRKLSAGKSVPFSASARVVNRAFGAPDSSVREYSEPDDLTYTRSTYSGLRIYFYDGSIESFDFSTTAFGLVFQDRVIKVGDHIRTLSSLFPRSYAARTRDQLFINLLHKGQSTDAHVVIFFDRDDRISYIIVGAE